MNDSTDVRVFANPIAAIREYFSLDGKPLAISEIKALSSEDRAELAQGIHELPGYSIEGR